MNIPDPKNKWVGWTDLGNHVLIAIVIALLVFIVKASYSTI